jgi:hypothetical protein
MTTPSDLDKMRVRARLLARFFAFAIQHLAHPGLARLRRALTRLEDQFRAWLIGMIYRAPEGLFGEPASIQRNASKSTAPPQAPRTALARRFRIGIAPLREYTGVITPRRYAEPKPERDQLAALNARLVALIDALDTPTRALNRLARILARRPLVIIHRDAQMRPPYAGPTAPAIARAAPEPHKRE